MKGLLAFFYSGDTIFFIFKLKHLTVERWEEDGIVTSEYLSDLNLTSLSVSLIYYLICILGMTREVTIGLGCQYVLLPCFKYSIHRCCCCCCCCHRRHYYYLRSFVCELVFSSLTLTLTPTPTQFSFLYLAIYPKERQK